MKPSHCNNVPSNSKCVPNYEQVNIENRKQSRQQKTPGYVKNSPGKELTIAEAVITHLGLDMLGNVSIDSHLMMDCVLK